MIDLPSPLPPISGRLLARLHALRDPDRAFEVLCKERIFGLVDGSDLPGLSSNAARDLDARLVGLRAHAELRQQAMARDLRRVVEKLRAAHVHPIALKGAALGPLLYPRLSARPSVDVDLFIPPEAVETVHRVMPAAGWMLPSGVRGQWVSGQFSYRSPRSPALATTIDFHWRITNRWRLQHVLSYAWVNARAAPAPTSWPFCACIHPVHALVHAIIHLVAHHGREEIPALWYLDIAALDAQMRAEERRAAMAFLRANDCLPIAAHVWKRTHAAIGFCPSSQTAFLLEERSRWRDRLRHLPATRFEEIFADVRVLRNAERAAYLRELLFPPASSLRAAYGPDAAQTPLWRLHARRLWRRGVHTEPPD